MGFFKSLFSRKRNAARSPSTFPDGTPTPEEVMRQTGMSEDELTRRFMEHLIQVGKDPFAEMPDHMRRQSEARYPDLAALARKKFGSAR